MNYLILLDGTIEEFHGTFALAGDILTCTYAGGQEVRRYEVQYVALYGDEQRAKTVVDKLKAFKALVCHPVVM